MCVCLCARSCQKHRSERSRALNEAGEKRALGGRGGGGSSHRGRMVSYRKKKLEEKEG